MNFSFKCPNCQQKLEADASWTGMETPCPRCDNTVTIPTVDFGSGVTVGGFRISRMLGRGGMGSVYLATQLSMDRDVALKVLSPALSNDRQFVDRFLREVRVLARLEHPNIVVAHEAGEDDGHHFLAMAYIDGESLDIRVRRDGPLPEQEALRIGRTVAQALAYAWEKQRLLHRDIKPANIMVDRDGQVKLMDVGISKSLMDETSLTMTGTLMGTPQYMSPEQARNDRDLDFRADIYSLGGTLYYLLTGSAPFQGKSSAEVVTQVLRDPPPSPRVANPALSSPCAELLTMVMAKNPAQRPSSWETLVTGIDAVLGGNPPATARLTADQDTVPAGEAAHVNTVVSTPAPGHGTVPIAVDESRGRAKAPRGKRKGWRRALEIVGICLLILFVLIIRGAAAKRRRQGRVEPNAAGNSSAAPALNQTQILDALSQLQEQRRAFYNAMAADLLQWDFDSARERARKARSTLQATGRATDLSRMEDWITQVEKKARELDQEPSSGRESESTRWGGGQQSGGALADAARGLVLFKAKRYDAAKILFRRLEGPIRPALVGQVERALGDSQGRQNTTKQTFRKRTPGRNMKRRPNWAQPDEGETE